MNIRNLTASITHTEESVHIAFEIPTADFLKFVNILKQAPKPIKVKAEAKPMDLKDRRDLLYAKVRDWQDRNPDKHPSPMLQKFMAYWGEANKTGTMIRYDQEKFFDIGRRLATFRGFVKPDDLNKMWEDHEKNKQQSTLFKK